MSDGRLVIAQSGALLIGKSRARGETPSLARSMSLSIPAFCKSTILEIQQLVLSCPSSDTLHRQTITASPHSHIVTDYRFTGEHRAIVSPAITI